MSQATASIKPAHFTFANGWQFKLGIAASIITTLIWSAFFLATRAGVTSTLTSFDLALLRFGFAAIVLLPITLRHWPSIVAIPKTLLIGILVGAGVPLFFLMSVGAELAPASHAGLIITGTTPIFISLAAVLFFKEKLRKQKIIGLSLIGAGILALLVLAFWEGDTSYWKGDVLFLCAAACWATFSICIRVAALPPLAVAGFLSLVSTFILLALLALGLVDSGFTDVSAEQLAIQVLVQSLGVGLLAAFTYGYAVNKIGAERSAAIGSLTPVLVGVAAVPLLGETLGLSSLAGMILVFIGVILSSGVKIPQLAKYSSKNVTHTRSFAE
ncbi:DMT family transporter [Agaribacter flavus]|uniref:DMT family transporter n=1 Tax=Agaribacter flavus TaxID=1902781 RepID=A0ABV7FVJ1_9ALTE